MLAEGEPRIREEQRALSLVVALTGSSWMVLLRFTMRMFPLGFYIMGFTCSCLAMGYAILMSYLPVFSVFEVLQGLSLCLQCHISFMCLLGEEYLYHQRLEKTQTVSCGFKTRTFGPWWLWGVVTSPLVFKESIQELPLSSSDRNKGSSSWVLSVRCPAIPVHVTTGLLIPAIRQLNRKPYHLKNHKTHFTNICWTLARDRHCGWWCRKGHKHK